MVKVDANSIVELCGRSHEWRLLCKQRIDDLNEFSLICIEIDQNHCVIECKLQEVFLWMMDISVNVMIFT